MAIDYSNLAKNPELYVDISNLAKNDQDAKFNLSNMAPIQEAAGIADDPKETEGDSGAGPTPVPNPDELVSPVVPGAMEPGLDPEKVYPIDESRREDAPAQEPAPVEQPVAPTQDPVQEPAPVEQPPAEPAPEQPAPAPETQPAPAPETQPAPEVTPQP